jgi:hypothetical protein
LIVRGPAGVSTNKQTSLIVVLNPPHLSVNPGSLNFGSVTIGQAATLSFTVVNTGNLTLTGSVTAAGAFAITAGAQLNLGAGQMQTVTVAFTPTTTGTFASAAVFITNGGSLTNSISGTGVRTAPPGDVNGDLRVNSSDSLLINQVLVGLRSSNDAIFQVAGYVNGDVNQDGFVTGADSLLINQQAVDLRSYVITKIVPDRRSNNVPTPVTIFGIGFPTNTVTGVSIGPPVNLPLSNVVVISRDQINALVPAGGGIGTGTVNVAATPTNGVISFGRFFNQ